MPPRCAGYPSGFPPPAPQQQYGGTAYPPQQPAGYYPPQAYGPGPYGQPQQQPYGYQQGPPPGAYTPGPYGAAPQHLPARPPGAAPKPPVGGFDQYDMEAQQAAAYAAAFADQKIRSQFIRKVG